MPPVRLKLALLDRLVAALDRDPPLAVDRRDVERVRAGAADVRLREPAEEDPQHRVGVGRGADRRARVGAHPLLVDGDRSREPVEHVDVGPRQRRHEALHERAVGLVDQPLRLRGDRAEHQRALARAGDAREHRQPALRDLDADVLEVVDARAVHADQVVAVGGVQRARRVRGDAHRVSICSASTNQRPSRISSRSGSSSTSRQAWMRRGRCGTSGTAWSASAGRSRCARRTRSPCSGASASISRTSTVALDHGDVAGVAQTQPDGPGGGQVPAGRAVRRRGHQQRLAVPVEGQRHQIGRAVGRGAGHPDVDVVGQPVLGVATTLGGGTGIVTHRPYASCGSGPALLIPDRPVTRLATQDGIPAVARDASRR